MKINYTTNSIEMSKTEAKKASVIGSKEYKALLDAKRDFPSYSIKITSRDIKRSDDIKGLTYDFMEKYIIENGVPEQLEKLKVLREGAFGTNVSYGEIRKWFLEEFPKIAAFREKINSILAHKDAV